MKRVLVVLCCLLFYPFHSYGQFSPGIHNYSLAEYNAGNQNWDVTRAENGKVYVANNSGLLEYNGIDWKFHQLPNKTTIRSVLAYKDLIFTGSFEEFGYWKNNEYGQLTYVSLSDTILEKISSNEEIWQINSYKDQIVFRSFQNIYVYDFNNIIQITPRSTIISTNVVNGHLLLATLNDGIFSLKDGQLEQFYSDDLLVGTKILAIKQFDGQLLLATALKGCFYLNNNDLIPSNFDIDKNLKQHQLNEFSILDNGDMVFGTIKNGVYLTDANGEMKFHISKENGLINNTVLGQYVSDEGSLWLGLDNGISKVDLNNHNYFFNDLSGKLGAVYDIIKYKGTVYIGSNTGLFRLDEADQPVFIEGSQGQVWNLKEIGGTLFCGHNEGTFLVEGDKLKQISSFTGGWTIKKVPERLNTYIQGTYSGLVKFENTNGKWQVSHLGKTTIPSRFLVFENQYTAWVAHAYKGLYKVRFDKNYDSIISIKNYLDHTFNVRVYDIKNNISFKTNKEWLKYEPLLDSIIPYDLLNEKLGPDSYIISEEYTDRIALRNSEGIISFQSFSNNYEDFTLTDNFFKDRYIVGYENVSKFNDSTYSLNLDNGFMLINTSYNASSQLFKPNIESISLDNHHININNIVDNQLSFKHNKNVILEVASPKSTHYFLEYKLSHSDDNWYRMENGKIELSNLRDGNYELSCRAADNSGKTSPVMELNVMVLPPWYKDTLGYLLYICLGILTVVLINILQRKKVEREQRHLRIKLQKEQQKLLREKTFENEKRIVQLKNESLENEIKIKSKQLANNAMALVKKNETLLDIKKELALNRDDFKNYYAYKKLIKKLDHSIEHKDEWKVFEENFNQVHDEFFENLTSRHPKLTPKDLKICAYIKMSLSNKEIAPLMNISVRGVETHRYRLKRKLDLENHISLTDYLLDIK
ncbi:LuxR C-terminal-related transcriptional regulator [Winogradskyella sp.]|uniref:helix-turn-helix and ligand-binding sensor domain-containing protein n=1 Tax=Winogradskyella sp. TaxID=1883156 RepID=UPI003BAC3584